MPTSVFQKAVVEYLSEHRAAPSKEMLEALVAKGIAEAQVRGAINRMSKRGMLEHSAKGWKLAKSVKGDPVKRGPRKALRTRVPAKPRALTPEMVKQLDMRINQSDRSLSLNLEGWRITIGFDQ